MPRDLYRWSPMSVAEVVGLFDAAPFRWWISGGYALELHLGYRWRPHEDIDVGIMRDQAPQAYTWLAGWDLHIAAAGVLRPWDGRPLLARHHENNVWIRRSTDQPWAVDLTVGAGTEDRWVHRRDPVVSRPWERAVLRNAAGVPYLAPELQLLFKSAAVQPKDDLDAVQVMPALTRSERRFLSNHLPAGHGWQPLLEDYYR